MQNLRRRSCGGGTIWLVRGVRCRHICGARKRCLHNLCNGPICRGRWLHHMCCVAALRRRFRHVARRHPFARSRVHGLHARRAVLERNERRIVRGDYPMCRRRGRGCAAIRVLGSSVCPVPSRPRLRWQCTRRCVCGGTFRPGRFQLVSAVRCRHFHYRRRGRMHHLPHGPIHGHRQRFGRRVQGLAIVRCRQWAQDRRHVCDRPSLRAVHERRPRHVVRNQRRRAVRAPDEMRARGVGVSEADAHVGSWLLDASCGVSRKPVHVCGPDGHERSRVPRREAVQRGDGVRVDGANAELGSRLQRVPRGVLL